MARRTRPSLGAIALVAAASLTHSRSFADEGAARRGPAAPAPAEAGAPTDVEPRESGFSLGARVAYALPMGSIAAPASTNGGGELSRTVSGALPLWVDAGFRPNRHLYVGGYFQLAPVFAARELCDRVAATGACSSSGHGVRFGAFAKYTFRPESAFAPWVGLGFGYEVLSVSATARSVTMDATVRGLEYASFHVGGDVRLTHDATIGPAVSLSVGQYSSYTQSVAGASQSSDFRDPALHEWLTIGVRGQLDL